MIVIGNKKIGDGEPCFITYEAGPTHDGVESAKKLIKYAADAGADAIKFQIFDPDKLVADKKQLFSYGVLKDRDSEEVETIEEPLYDILARRCLSNDEWREVKEYSDGLDLAFFSTVGFDEDIELLEELNCHSIKIASADVNHYPLLKKVAKTGMCVQLDTGMATLGEIEAAIDVIRAEGNENIIIHQCPSGYPARLESINLNIIPTLKKMFSYPVAFSDHTPGSDMDIAAIALGANLVEKTITENRMTRSVEHIMSIEPHDMKKFIQTIREIEIALGTSRRELHPDEVTKRDEIRRSLFIMSDAKAGQKISECDVEFRRPGYGIPPDQFEMIKNAQLKIDISSGDILTMQHIEWN
jgi:N,N'-diacetyllegionaminate synthase